MGDIVPRLQDLLGNRNVNSIEMRVYDSTISTTYGIEITPEIIGANQFISSTSTLFLLGNIFFSHSSLILQRRFSLETK